jgi:hypothetical protein
MTSDSNIKPSVTDKVAGRTTPDDIAAFRRSAGIGANRIIVDASGRDVVLTGGLRSWAQRRAPD